jgi:hypothetical protein
MKEPRRLSTVKRLAYLYPDAGFTDSSIRWLIFNSEENGFGRCIRRLGKKVLIDIEEFEDWMDNYAARYSGD